MHHKQQGQATVYVLVGIVLLVVVILVSLLRGQFSLPFLSREPLPDALVALTHHIEDCIKSVGEEPLDTIGSQGGYLKLSEDTFASYNGSSISFLCYNRADDLRCYNRMLTLREMEGTLSYAINEQLSRCFSFSKFKRGVDLQVGRTNVATVINPDTVIVTLHMPIVLRRGDTTVQQDSFSHVFSLPLGRLYTASQIIVDGESEFGEFDYISYILDTQGTVFIDQEKPYPHVLYTLRTDSSPYLFRFMIQGERGLLAR